MMTSASASGGDGGVAGSLSAATYGSSTAIAKFCSTDGRALGFARAGLRLGKISGIWQRYSYSLPSRARARLGGAMRLLDRPGRAAAAGRTAW